MSLIMTQTEHYPMNNHNDNSPTQSSMGFMNGFPPGHFNNTTSVNNQWQQMNRSPNSMGSNGSPSGIMHSNMPAAPSPLLNSVNSSSIMSNQGMGGGGTPQQPGSVKTPLSVQQQTSSNPGLMTLKNPFEEDLESRPASRQQMPPPTNTNQRLYFDIIKEVRSPMYCNGNDPMFRLRLPMAYNTIGAEMNLPYPNTNINRSPSIPIQKSMPLQMPPQMPPQMQMPVTSSAPIPQQPATTTRKRQTKKQKEQQEQMQASQMNGGGPMPNFPHGMLPMAIDPSRPCSSHDLNTRSSPGTIQMNMKVLGRSPSTDVFPHLPGRNIPMKLMPNEKCATENYNCFHCNSLITSERKGIRCTAINQGCFQCYHIDCAGLNMDAYNYLIKDPRCEWVCKQCQQMRPILFHT